jgi:hypothetical protein
VCELGFELVKDGFTKSSRDVANNACDSPTYRVLSIFGPDDALMGQRMHVHIRCTERQGTEKQMRTLIMRSDVSGCGQRVGYLSTSSRVTVASKLRNSGESASSISSLSSSASAAAAGWDGSTTDEGKQTFPTEETKATISMS